MPEDVKVPMSVGEAQRMWLHQIFASARERKLYGTFTFKIEAGLVKRFTKEESIMPPGVQALRSD